MPIREPEPDTNPALVCPKCGRKPIPSWGNKMFVCKCGWTMTYTEWIIANQEPEEGL